MTPPRAERQPIILQKQSPSQGRQVELEADLQFLLDAQAESLTIGLQTGLLDDRSTGSTTPTARSVRSGSARLSSRPPKRKPGIRSARKGIYNSITALSSVKSDELEDIDLELRAKDQTLAKIEGWQEKKERLQDATKNVEANEDTVRSQRLRQEADALQEEINHVELQLADMKSRHRKLLKEAASAENAVQAKLASYTSSLRLLEEDVQKFLSSKPVDASTQPYSPDGQASLWQLPSKRRTLDMAKQYWNEEREATLRQRETADREKNALDEGAIVWKDVVVQLTEFERLLRADVSKIKVEEERNTASQPQISAEVLGRMDSLITDLESKFEHSKARNWNLLIAAIGTELDALMQGRDLLVGHTPSSMENAAGNDPSASNTDGSVSDEEHQDLDKSSATVKRRISNGAAAEDDPDPELLFSQHETDSE
jgi:hypothetical protein